MMNFQCAINTEQEVAQQYHIKGNTETPKIVQCEIDIDK